jgi:hypothetical protein
MGVTHRRHVLADHEYSRESIWPASQDRTTVERRVLRVYLAIRLQAERSRFSHGAARLHLLSELFPEMWGSIQNADGHESAKSQDGLDSKMV